MIRQFRLVGLKQAGIGNDSDVSLNDFNKYLLTLPTDLGFEFENTYIKVGSDRIVVKQEREFKAFTGTIEVTGSTRDEWEKNYNELRDFIAKNKNDGFKLYYKNRANAERYIECDIKRFDKTEKNSYCIPVMVEFDPRTLWLQDSSVSIALEDVDLQGSIMAFLRDEGFDANDPYGYNYGYLYDPALDDHNVAYVRNASSGASLANMSDDIIPLKITIYGECKDPVISLINSNGVAVQTCRIFADIQLGEVLVLNSDPKNLGITLRRINGNVINITNSRDVSLVSFLRLPTGEYTLNIREYEDAGRNISGNIRYSLRYIGA